MTFDMAGNASKRKQKQKNSAHSIQVDSQRMCSLQKNSLGIMEQQNQQSRPRIRENNASIDIHHSYNSILYIHNHLEGQSLLHININIINMIKCGTFLSIQRILIKI